MNDGILFILTQKQKYMANVWMEKHNQKCIIENVGAIGGKYSYEFTPTSLGVCQTIKCACGDKKELTDFDNW